jgi:hypothetical protein
MVRMCGRCRISASSGNARARNLFRHGGIARTKAGSSGKSAVALSFPISAMLPRDCRPEGGVNSHVNAARSHMDQPGPGPAGRRRATNLESPVPDIRFVGGRYAVFDALVDHEQSRVGSGSSKDDLHRRRQSGQLREKTPMSAGSHADTSRVAGRGYSVTSSARASSVGAMSRPSVFAAFRLMTSSNLTGCSTGRSPGFAPRRILSTNSPARLNRSEMSGP